MAHQPGCAERGRQILAARLARGADRGISFLSAQAVTEAASVASYPASSNAFNGTPSRNVAFNLAAAAQTQADTVFELGQRLQQRLAEESVFDAMLTQCDALRTDVATAEAALHQAQRALDGAASREADAQSARSDELREWAEQEKALRGALVDAASERDTLQAALEANEARVVALEVQGAVDRCAPL